MKKIDLLNLIVYKIVIVCRKRKYVVECLENINVAYNFVVECNNTHLSWLHRIICLKRYGEINITLWKNQFDLFHHYNPQSPK